MDALDGIKQNVEAIRSSIAGMEFATCDSDLRTRYAVVRALEIISEASRRLSDDTKARWPEVPWRAIRDAGNVDRHAYARLAIRLVRETASGQLDDLWTVVTQESRRGDPSPANDENGL